jgi:O-methyltransferase involved in polyketide biosynthesis
MRQNQSSLTAMGIAVLRAAEMDKPADERICSDPLARGFIPAWFFYFMKLFLATGSWGWAGLRGGDTEQRLNTDVITGIVQRPR